MSPFVLLLFLLLTVPLVEIYVLIEVGQSVGSGPTVALVVFTAVVGAWLLRWQGLHTLARVQAAVDRRELPAVELIEGVILIISGVLLLTPGFVTDAIGFACLIPAVRRGFAVRLVNRFIVTRVGGYPAGDRTIDGEYRVDDERKPLDPP
jgi:UPF0716 protein FxsA